MIIRRSNQKIIELLQPERGGGEMRGLDGCCEGGDYSALKQFVILLWDKSEERGNV